MEWTNVHSCLRDAVLTIANFRNTMETFECEITHERLLICHELSQGLLDWEGGFEERERVSAQRDECPTLMSLR